MEHQVGGGDWVWLPTVGVDQRERETVPWRASGDESPESQATVLWTPRIKRTNAFNNAKPVSAHSVNLLQWRPTWGQSAAMEQSPLAAILGHLTQMSDRQTQLQRTQNEVLLELGQSLTADRAVLQELLVSGNRDREPRAAGAVGHIHVPKMGETDDAEAFLETFRGVAEVSGWPRQEWAHRLLPLLTGEAQLAAHSLPAGAQRDYEAVDKAIRDRLGLNPEEHRRRFRALTFSEGDRPFTYAQQLRDQARRWLAPERNNPEEIVEQVALERFVEGLPARTSTWVRYHRPESLSAAVNIAEGHLIPPSTDRRPPAPTPSPRTGAAALRGYKPTPLPRARRAIRRQGRGVGGADGRDTFGGTAR
ncbi:SCAN domain-containing protein 3 [Merluccius polli]|uniref:SCAN domain-containing protein 3 n=1 Tax=Merluccius polli TaxID=89951 RepID=A0AA47N7B6_MERPO|nr:SCAN domain-containing protein 3 [Merluccius polli]